MEITIIILLVILIGLIGFTVLRSHSSSTSSAQTTLMMQQQIDGLRNELAQSMKYSTDVVFQTMKSTTDAVTQQLSAVTQSIHTTTEQMNQQLSAQTSTIGNRLDNAARVIQDLQKSQGQMLEAGKEIRELGQNVQKLEELLKAPKLRGGLGEFLLEDLLKQVLPSSNFAMQYRFRNGNTVDAIVKTANGIIPIDSKFPLENFRKMVELQNDAEKKSAYKTFTNDVKKHIDAIAQKYILPDEGTFDFALMYIPAENIYYETIIKNEMFGDENTIYNYAIQRRVFSVSPNTFYAQLHIIALGFKGMEVEKGAKEIMQNLSRLQGDLQKFAEDFDTVGKHLTNAKNKYDDAARKLDTFETKLIQSSIQSIGTDNEQGLLKG